MLYNEAVENPASQMWQTCYLKTEASPWDNSGTTMHNEVIFKAYWYTQQRKMAKILQFSA